MTIKYNILPGKIVEGFCLGKYFGCHKMKDGWKITHLPSGMALCDPVFDSKETAQALVVAVELSFKDLLNSNDPLLLQKGTEQNQICVRDFLKLLNDNPKTIVAGYALDFFRERAGL